MPKGPRGKNRIVNAVGLGALIALAATVTFLPVTQGLGELDDIPSIHAHGLRGSADQQTGSRSSLFAQRSVLGTGLLQPVRVDPRERAQRGQHVVRAYPVVRRHHEYIEAFGRNAWIEDLHGPRIGRCRPQTEQRSRAQPATADRDLGPGRLQACGIGERVPEVARHEMRGQHAPAAAPAQVYPARVEAERGRQRNRLIGVAGSPVCEYPAGIGHSITG